MSTSILPVLYQTETFGASLRHTLSGKGQGQSFSDMQKKSIMEQKTMRASSEPKRYTPVLVQLMVGGDPDLRKALGRRDIAVAREAAYGMALAHRGGQNPGTQQRETLGIA